MVTDARITSRILRCRSVSDEPAPCRLPDVRSVPSGVSVLSVMALNVVRIDRLIKHVFEVCLIGAVWRCVEAVRTPFECACGFFVGGASYGSQQFDHMFYKSNKWAIQSNTRANHLE